MKFKKLLALFLFSAALVSAAPTATLTATFEHDPVDPTVEYVVEVKLGDVWTEVAKGSQSPITWVQTHPYGLLAARVFYRILPEPIPRDVAVDTSLVATTVIRPVPASKVNVKRDK